MAISPKPRHRQRRPTPLPDARNPLRTPCPVPTRMSRAGRRTIAISRKCGLHRAADRLATTWPGSRRRRALRHACGGRRGPSRCSRRSQPSSQRRMPSWSPRTGIPEMAQRQAFDAPWLRRGMMALLLPRGAPRPAETPSRPSWRRGARPAAYPPETRRHLAWRRGRRGRPPTASLGGEEVGDHGSNTVVREAASLGVEEVGGRGSNTVVREEAGREWCAARTAAMQSSALRRRGSGACAESCGAGAGWTERRANRL